MTEAIRFFARTSMELGVEHHDDGQNRAWFVMDRVRGGNELRGQNEWHTHCGPYSTREQAVAWIQAIRETYHAVLGPVVR